MSFEWKPSCPPRSKDAHTHFGVSFCVHLLVRASHSLILRHQHMRVDYLPMLKSSQDTLVCSLSSFCVSLPVSSASPLMRVARHFLFPVSNWLALCSKTAHDVHFSSDSTETWQFITENRNDPAFLTYHFSHLVLWLVNVFMVLFNTGTTATFFFSFFWVNFLYICAKRLYFYVLLFSLLSLWYYSDESLRRAIKQGY